MTHRLMLEVIGIARNAIPGVPSVIEIRGIVQEVLRRGSGRMPGGGKRTQLRVFDAQGGLREERSTGRLFVLPVPRPGGAQGSGDALPP